MKTRPTLLLFLIALLCLATPVAQADLRQELGPDRAQLIERALIHIHPGSVLEWTPTLTLVQSGVRRAVRIGGIDLRKDDDGGFTGALAFEWTDNRAAIFQAVYAFEPAPSPSPAEIAVFKANAQREITDVRRGSLSDPAAVIESVERVELTLLTFDQPWPDVYVSYTGLYATPDFHGQIKWEEKVTFEPVAVASGRAPSALSRREKKSSIERSDLVTVDVVDENTISFASSATGHVISNCADPCLPDGRVLLALWWTSTTATP